uniref:Si605023c06a n=1 Tax=Arundo donax TaxID=35708 RepID=A0A0A8Z0G2_ARUDO
MSASCTSLPMEYHPSTYKSGKTFLKNSFFSKKERSRVPETGSSTSSKLLKISTICLRCTPITHPNILCGCAAVAPDEEELAADWSLTRVWCSKMFPTTKGWSLMVRPLLEEKLDAADGSAWEVSATAARL